jgi:hypothetical protein
MSTAELTVMNADNLTAEAFQVDLDAIKTEAAQYALLTINDINDKEGFRVLEEARLTLKRTRNAIDKRRKELGEGARLYVNKVNEVAKELTAIVSPVEDTLEAREKEHLNQLAAVEQQKLSDRMEKLTAIRCQHPASLVKSMSDKQFDEFLATATESHAAAIEAERVAAEEKAAKEAAEAEARRLEDERLKAEREALERERLELAEQRRKQEEEDSARRAQEQATLKAEQDRLDNARREQEAALAKQREEEEARLQAQRDELARQQAEIDAANAERERIEREQREAEQRALEEADRLRLIEETKPDREKVLKFLDTLDQLELPVMATPNGERVKQEIDELLKDASTEARRWVRELLPTN